MRWQHGAAALTLEVDVAAGRHRIVEDGRHAQAAGHISGT
jgi:hypothetical protein